MKFFTDQTLARPCNFLCPNDFFNTRGDVGKIFVLCVLKPCGPVDIEGNCHNREQPVSVAWPSLNEGLNLVPFMFWERAGFVPP